MIELKLLKFNLEVEHQIVLFSHSQYSLESILIDVLFS